MNAVKTVGTNETPTLTCVVVGDTAKSIFIEKNFPGQFTKEYVMTLGAKEYSLVFHTNRGAITMNIWDTAEQDEIEKFQKQLFLLARKLIGDPNLELVVRPVPFSPDVSTDEEWEELELNVEEAHQTALPSDDDEDL